MPCFCSAVKTKEGKRFPHKEADACRSLRADEEFCIVAVSEFQPEARHLARQSAVHVNAVNGGRAK